MALQDRGARCVAARDDVDSQACVLKTAEENDNTCDSINLFNTHCVCEIPANNACLGCWHRGYRTIGCVCVFGGAPYYPALVAAVAAV